MSLPVGVASTNAHAVFAWDDTRHTEPGSVAVGEFGGGVQDIYTGVVQFEAFGGGTPKIGQDRARRRGRLAVVAGVLRLATVLSRRRTSPPPRERKAAKTPVGVS